MTKLPTTREEYEALTDEERAEVDGQVAVVMEHARAFTVALAAQVQEMAALIGAWYASLPPDVRADIDRLAESEANEEARSA